MVGVVNCDAWGGNMQQETCLLIDKNVSEKKKNLDHGNLKKKIFFLFFHFYFGQ